MQVENVYSLYGNLHPIFAMINNCSQRVIAEPESKSIAKCPLGYCVCT